MINIKDTIENKFVSVSRIIILLVTLTFCYLCIVGKISASEFMPIFCLIIGFYFGKSTALDNACKAKENS